MTPDTCDDCRALRNGQCALYPVAVPLPESRWCAQFRALKVRFAQEGNRKASDFQLWEALSTWEDDPNGTSKFSASVQAVAAALRLTRRTVEERFKAMHTRGVIKIYTYPNTNIRGVQTADGPDGLRAPWPDGTQAQGDPGTPAAEPYARSPNLKFTFADLAPHVGSEPQRFSRLAEACHRMSRPAFTRVLREAVRDGYIEKTPEGLYLRTDKASDF